MKASTSKGSVKLIAETATDEILLRELVSRTFKAFDYLTPGASRYVKGMSMLILGEVIED